MKLNSSINPKDLNSALIATECNFAQNCPNWPKIDKKAQFVSQISDCGLDNVVVKVLDELIERELLVVIVV